MGAREGQDGTWPRGLEYKIAREEKKMENVPQASLRDQTTLDTRWLQFPPGIYQPGHGRKRMG